MDSISTRFILLRQSFQLARYVAVEEGAEARIGIDQAQHVRAGREGAKGFLARSEAADSDALNDGAAVEEILGTEQADQFALLALLDAAFDDDIETFRGRALGDDRLIGAEIGDIHRSAQGFGFFGGQAVEGGRRIV